MPTIRVDDDIYRYLQERAQPFIDSPNDVLRRLLLGDSAGDDRDPNPPPDDPDSGRTGQMHMRRDASGLGDDDRYLRGRLATIYNKGNVYKRSGVRSPRGADLNQVQTWVAELVGLRNSANATLIHNLRTGSTNQKIGDVLVVIEPQTGGEE
jgi:hypothetical protein